MIFIAIFFFSLDWASAWLLLEAVQFISEESSPSYVPLVVCAGSRGTLMANIYDDGPYAGRWEQFV